MNMTNLASIGIIGGADGPTAVFVTGDGWGLLAVAGIIGVVAGFFIFKKTRK